MIVWYFSSRQKISTLKSNIHFSLKALQLLTTQTKIQMKRSLQLNKDEFYIFEN